MDDGGWDEMEASPFKETTTAIKQPAKLPPPTENNHEVEGGNRQDDYSEWMKIAFIITRKRNNIVVSFGTLKVQSFMLTEVRDCDLLIVVTFPTFLKRKDILKEKSS